MVFFTALGVRFAADTDQISTMVDLGAVESLAPVLLSLEERLGGGPAGSGTAGPAAKGLILKTADASPLCLVVDDPSDITAVSIDRIRELPLLIRSACPGLPIWGVLPAGGRLVLLLDLESVRRSA